MTSLTSALNYGALITLSCCNAVLQIAAAPGCAELAQESNWPACALDGALAETDVRRTLFQPGRTKPVALAHGARVAEVGPIRFTVRSDGDGNNLDSAPTGGDTGGRDWQTDGDRAGLGSGWKTMH